MDCAVLYCIVLYCTVSYCTVLYCTVLYCIVLYFMYYIVFGFSMVEWRQQMAHWKRVELLCHPVCTTYLEGPIL